MLSEHRRRENELEVLYLTAGDLSSLRDVELVLQAIVDRVQELLGADVAYLTLIDETRGQSYVRVTAGIKTATFRHIPLTTAGLGGLVVKFGTPVMTADYATDARFASHLDDRIRAEGLVALMGVPSTEVVHEPAQEGDGRRRR